jgi:hypothetical protein
MKFARVLSFSAFIAAIVAALPLNASAATGSPTLVVGQTAELVAHLMAVVPVTITCDPRTPLTYASAQGMLQQAVVHNTNIARQSISLGDPTFNGGMFFNIPPSGAITCDSAPHAYSFGFIPSIPPLFEAGDALINASATVCTGTPDTFTPQFTVLSDCATASNGTVPQVIHIKLSKSRSNVSPSQLANLVANRVHIDPIVVAAAQRAAALSPAN